MKVLWKFISLICFRVCLEVNVHKNPTCFSRWSIRFDDDFIRKYTYQELADDGYKLETIQSCCCGQNKTSNGYKWKYEESTASSEASS